MSTVRLEPLSGVRAPELPTSDAAAGIDPREADYAFIADPARRRLALHAFALDGPAPTLTLRRAEPSRQAERLRFYDFPSSPFCVKLRGILRYKGLRFQGVDPLAPRHWLTLQRRGSGKVPALDIDGRFITDSTDIAWELDRLYPAHPVVPGEPRSRALCHALEEWADESLYLLGLHYLWLDPRSAGQVQALFGRGPIGRLTYPVYRRLIQRQVRGQGTGRRTAAQIEADLLRHLDQASTLLADRPFLLGEQPWLCDFAMFGQLAFLQRANASRETVRRHPVLTAFVDRMRVLAQA